MDRKQPVTLHEAMEELGLTSNLLLQKVNLIALSLVEENARLYSDSDTKRKKYIDSAVNGKSVGMSRATLFNILTGKHKASKDKAMLIRTAINETRKQRHLKAYTEEELLIDVFVR